MSAYEAKKAFHLMDVDGNSSLTRSEFVSALALSEPSLHLEDIRKKVRQRYKSIREALVSTDDHSGDQEARARFKRTKLSDFLSLCLTQRSPAI
eukprot:3219254-Amphidinium_carterae.1